MSRYHRIMATIPDDGDADGGEPYTDDEMDIISAESESVANPTRVVVVDGEQHDLIWSPVEVNPPDFGEDEHGSKTHWRIDWAGDIRRVYCTQTSGAGLSRFLPSTNPQAWWFLHDGRKVFVSASLPDKKADGKRGLCGRCGNPTSPELRDGVEVIPPYCGSCTGQMAHEYHRQQVEEARQRGRDNPGPAHERIKRKLLESSTQAVCTKCGKPCPHCSNLPNMHPSMSSVAP